MKIPLKLLTLGWLTAGMFLTAARAQTPAVSTGETSPATAPAASQAPDEATRKIAELVHAGKYAEAQQLTIGLLVAYPEDQRLIKAKGMLEKILAGGGAVNGPANSHAPASDTTSAPSAGNANEEQLTGMEKVDYNALIELARQAQQTTDLDQQKASLNQFLDQSTPFLRKHPHELLLWQLRAASAISLNEPMVGYEAGQQLLTMGAADSNDPNLQSLLAQLKNKNWLDQQEAENLFAQQRYILVAFLGEADDTPTHSDLRSAISSEMNKTLVSKYPSRQNHFVAPDPRDPPPLLALTFNVHGTTLSPCTYSAFKNVWKCPAQTSLTVEGSSPEGWRFNKTYTFSGGTSGVGWGTARTPLTPFQVQAWISHGVAETFREILDADDVRAAFSKSTLRAVPPVAHPSALRNDPVPERELPADHVSEPAGHSASEPVLAAVQSSASARVTSTFANASNTTILHVYRPHRLTAAAQKPYIFVDGKKITPIANSQEIRMLLAPGKHTISVSKKYVDNELPINDLDMAAGSEYWIRVDISAGAWAAHSKLFVVPGDQAQLESKRMEEIKIGDISMN
ncbi:MAG: DUF2846 domain-containing protein [Acidobacteria bacterium]|nr:DUF2846 domain-containing protein [Acidobacteriota bacterium]MBS1864898.1 DUF2846 domain-containing protein [Acidobacteriota bacterium]